MKDVFIHVGLQKTGTTALQNSVFANMKDVQYFHYMDWYTKVKPDVDILFSNEDLSGFPIGHRLNRYSILDNIKQAFPTAKIIVGFRDLDSWQKSLYIETVRQGYTHSFSSYKDSFNPLYLDNEMYEDTLRKYFSDVFVYQFEELKKDFDEVVKDICDFLNKDIPEYDNKKINISLNSSQAKGLRLINCFCKSWLNPNGLLPGKIPHRLIGRIGP
jgi:hypothetical protein